MKYNTYIIVTFVYYVIIFIEKHASAWDRTRDLSVNSRALYQLSHGGWSSTPQKNVNYLNLNLRNHTVFAKRVSHMLKQHTVGGIHMQQKRLDAGRAKAGETYRFM